MNQEKPITFSATEITLLFVLVSTCLIYFISLYDYGYIHGDEGFSLMGSWRISMGQVPMRDFFMGLPPFSFLPTALVFKLFGTTLFSARMLVCFYAVLLIVSCDLLARNFVQNPFVRFLVAIYLVPYGVFAWRIPSHHWVIAICQVLTLWALVNAIKYAVSRFRWSFIAGAFTALGCFTMQDQGGYLLISLLIFFFPLIKDKTARKTIFIWWCMGGLSVATAFFLYLLPFVPFRDIFYYWFTFPLQRYTMLSGNVGSLAALGWQQIGTQQWMDTLKVFPAYTLSQTFFTILLPILPLIALGILVTGFIQKRLPGWQLGLLFSGFIAFTGGSLHRYSQTYLIWAAPMYMIIIAWWMQSSISRGCIFVRRLSYAASCMLIFMSSVYIVGSLRMTYTTPKVTVHGRAGAVIVPADSTQSSMQMVLNAIEKYVPAKAPLFCTQYNPLINFWTQRINPTPVDFIITYEDLLTEEQIEEVINSLKNNPDTFVLLFVPMNRDNAFNAYVLDNFRPVWRGPWALLLASQKK